MATPPLPGGSGFMGPARASLTSAVQFRFRIGVCAAGIFVCGAVGLSERGESSWSEYLGSGSAYWMRAILPSHVSCVDWAVPSLLLWLLVVGLFFFLVVRWKPPGLSPQREG